MALYTEHAFCIRDPFSTIADPQWELPVAGLQGLGGGGGDGNKEVASTCVMTNYTLTEMGGGAVG